MMRVENFQVAAPDALCFSKAGVPVPDNDEADVSSSFIDPVELESLGLILEFSL